MLSASAAFATDDDATLTAVDDEITIDENVLSVEEDDALEITEEDVVETNDDSDVVSAPSTVTNATFHDYFDETGNLTSDAEELIFEGDFTGIDVKYINIEKSVKLTGNNAIFKDVSFVISANDVVIDGFKLYMDDVDTALISVGDAKDVTISNNVIDYKSLNGFNSYAIFADSISNLKLINNAITYVGTNGTTVNNAIRIEGDKESKIPSKGIEVKGNNFTIAMPSVEIAYDAYYNPTILSEGIVIYYCEDINFTDNKVDFKYNSFDLGKYGYDTIHAVSIRSDANAYEFNDDDEIIYPIVSKNILVKNNEIKVTGHNDTYALFVSGDNIEISQNTINVTAEKYCAHGIQIGDLSFNGIVKDNKVYAYAENAVYGIYGYSSFAPVENITYKNNTIVVDGYTTCGMEIVCENPYIEGNTITATGNNTFGICVDANGNGTVSSNNVTCSGSNIGLIPSGDPMVPAKTSRALSLSGNLMVKNNRLSSSCVGIYALSDGEMEFKENDISVIANNPDVNNYAININAIDGVKFSDNNLTFIGKTNGDSITNAVYMLDTPSSFVNNNFIITVPAADIKYGPAYEETVISEGIVFDNVDKLNFEENTVLINYGDITGFYDTIRGIDIIGSENVTVIKNNITAVGNKYIYAIKATANNFNISENNINVISGYYSNGINIEGPAKGIIDKNNISTLSSNSAYPIYIGMTNAAINTTISNNNLNGESYYVVAVEVGGDQIIVENNTIDAKGNHTIGIGAHVNELIVNNNKINSIASNEGNIDIWDNFGTDSAGIIVSKGNFSISNNEIETTGDYAINSMDEDGNITNNKLSSNAGAGDSAIIGLGNITASGNPATANKYLKVILFADDFTKVEGSADKFVVKMVDENGKAIGNKTIKLTIDNVVYSSVSDFEGNVAFAIDLAKGEYFATIKFDGDSEYGYKSITSAITVKEKPAPAPAPKPTPKATKITAKKKTFKAKIKTKKYTITLKSGNAAVKNAKVTLKVKGKTFKATTNAKGKATFKIKNLKKKGKYTATIKFKGDKTYKASSKKVKITVKK